MILPDFVLKILKAKKRTMIRNGKLWEITTVFGKDISEVEQSPIEALPFQAPEACEVGSMRVNIILAENNVTNLTKHADLL